MNLEQQLTEKTAEALQSLYGASSDKIAFEQTNPDFTGDLTLVVFNFLKISKKKPEDTANDIGTYLKTNVPEIADFNVVKGFLNLVIADSFWLNYFKTINSKSLIQPVPANAPTVMVEYASPNTNKPLHLGHVRNILLGYSVSNILTAAGNKVVKTSVVNDRGIHICKSMLAWQKWGNGETPESSGLKGDHLVGKYYVMFETEYKKELAKLLEEAKKIFRDQKLKNIVDEIEKASINEKTLIIKQYEAKEDRRLIESFVVGFAAAILSSIILEKDKNKENKKLASSLILGAAAGLIYSQYSKSNNSDELNERLNKLDKLEKIKIKKEADNLRLYIEENITSKNAKNRKVRFLYGHIIEELKKSSPLIIEIQEMLRKWEANDKEVRDLWTMMNGWVYEGFAASYKMMGVDFDSTYYESNTYLLGKEIIDTGLAKGVLKTRSDKSIFIDLTADGLDEKTLLRSDGTSVYMTQDLGTALLRHQEVGFEKMIYTVGNEQDYHFKVLFLILKKLGFAWADGLYHLSYGMVELPEGKMKSREGTVVDADDLMQEMIDTATKTTKELGKVEGLSEEEANHLYKTIGLGALKYFMLKIDPKKKMLFNPAESIDFNGNTAPFIQFNYVRIQALLRKAKDTGVYNENATSQNTSLLPKEKELIIKLHSFDATLKQAANELSPALIANYTYDLAKEFSQYYHDTPILKEENNDLIQFRLQLAKTIGIAIKNSMGLLGIEVPERM